ncbi:MAG: helix-turn-helix transcriptional regulator, partial [Alphaproteobacteria bacterium]
DGLIRDARGRLRAWRGEDAQALDAAVRHASSTAAGRGDSSRSLLTVQRRSRRTPYLVTVSPLADDGAELDPRFRGAVVTVIDPDDRATVSTAGLAQLYGLTPAEAEIAGLMAQGSRPAAIAELRGTSVQTVRSQVKCVLAKTRSASRADLVRLAVLVDPPIETPIDLCGG